MRESMDEDFAKAVEDEVVRIEQITDAELVVVSASQSGQYRDIAMAGAAVLTLLLGVTALAVPYTISLPTFVVLLVVAFPSLVWLLDSPWFVGSASRASRKAQQVREAAESEFVREAVHGTPNRTGVLVYRSALERRVEVVVDFGVGGKVPKGELELALQRFGSDREAFLAGLRALGALLEKRVPATAQSAAFDLHNAPRIRP
jgi:putative membrane protein